MSKIDDVQNQITQQRPGYFSHISEPNYVRILDTPGTWGRAFGPEVMPRAHERQADFERAINEIVQKSRYRCDLASLNSPDPDWSRVVLGAMDTALSQRMGRTRPIQFRFLFGQTPLHTVSLPPVYTAFRAGLLRLVRSRKASWEQMPEIWLGRFYRLRAGVVSSLKAQLFPPEFISDDDTKMTWNHAKIIAMDGSEALVGGHNLNMDLFRSYPPVHDVSVIVHGAAAEGAQRFLNEMWACGKDLLTCETLDVTAMTWQRDDDDRRKQPDPLDEADAKAYIKERQEALISLHESGEQGGPAAAPPADGGGAGSGDQQTLIDLARPVFPERVVDTGYAGFHEYRRSTRMLAVGKYWTGPNMKSEYKDASEIMKRTLIEGAERTILMSQMDLISAWKKKWSDHVVCRWLMAALLAKPELQVRVVVSPQDGGAGEEGDQYSFGSGARRTFDLIEYYMTHCAETDRLLPDPDLARARAALKRLHVAPFYYTDRVLETQTAEGLTYAWPDLSPEGYTATLKRPPLADSPPSQGIIGSAAFSVFNASGYYYDKVASAPGNHAKIMIVDDEIYVVGSDNLYPGSLSEFNYLIEGEAAVREMLGSYWDKLWQYSGPHAVSTLVVPHDAIAGRTAGAGGGTARGGRH
ncbi:hypothetical protein [Burkholderia plantarii]|uniref:hypothetical protein n=1 Tax=Burkholderia plantarii TaxID=41899 RepID=UPI000706E6BD|nr:hypothetical protein [Burkholderia plantarii]ALK34259.1 Phospholipase D [Burkholderia plantarii]GLZ20606.1 hypothetical protein Bpla01_41350 [Burkholderia plantarii]